MFPSSYPYVSTDVSNVFFFLILRIIGLQILLFPEEIYLLENVLFLISSAKYHKEVNFYSLFLF